MSRFRGPAQDSRFTQAMAGAMSEIEPLTTRYDQIIEAAPPAGSRAEADQHHPVGELLWLQAVNLWVVAADHAVAWRELLTQAGVQPMRAHGTLMRGCLECAVLCRWLVDPSSDQPERLGRAVGLQLADYDQRRKFEDAAGSSARPVPPPAKRAKEREADLRTKASANRVAIVQPLGYVDLFGRYSAGGWLYRVLSAFAHGKQWALLVSDRANVREARSLPGGFQGTVTADDELAVAATRYAMDALGAAMADLEAYYRGPQ